jgi:hypothetical protein
MLILSQLDQRAKPIFHVRNQLHRSVPHIGNQTRIGLYSLEHELLVCLHFVFAAETNPEASIQIINN